MQLVLEIVWECEKSRSFLRKDNEMPSKTVDFRIIEWTFFTPLIFHLQKCAIALLCLLTQMFLLIKKRTIN